MTDLELLEFGGHRPVVHATAYIAPGARLIGQVRVEAEASIWFNAVLRGDDDRIVVGERSNIQDGCVLHADSDLPALVGAGVTVGHGAIVHAATVEDGCLIGMHAVVLTGARIGAGSLIGAQALVGEGQVIPPGSLVLGVPGRVVRQLRPEEEAGLVESAAHYVKLARRFREA